MQSIPLAVLKLNRQAIIMLSPALLHAIHTACGIETMWRLFLPHHLRRIACNPYRLRYWNFILSSPFYVEQIACNPYRLRYWNVFLAQSEVVGTTQLHAIHTACGIETWAWNSACQTCYIACNPYRLRYWNSRALIPAKKVVHIAQLHAIHTACGIETHDPITVFQPREIIACNPYRLRYWNLLLLEWKKQKRYLIIACNPYRLRYWNTVVWAFCDRSQWLHAIHTACGIETLMARLGALILCDCMQSIPLAVLKRT